LGDYFRFADESGRLTQSATAFPPFVAPLFATVQDYVGTSHIAITWQVGFASIIQHLHVLACPKLALADKR